MFVCKTSDADCDQPVVNDITLTDTLQINIGVAGVSLQGQGDYNAYLVVNGEVKGNAVFTITQASGGVIPCGTVNVPANTTNCDPRCPSVINPFQPGTWWCPCGVMSGSICCPKGQFPSQCPGSPGEPPNGMVCNTQTNTCGRTYGTPLCSAGSGTDQAYINTAIGCVPFDSIENMTGFLISRVVAVAGGLTLLLSGAGSIQVLTAGENKDKLMSGQSMLTSAFGGVLLIIFSTFVLRIIGINILQLFQ